jgi:hypothetical protein
VKPTDRLPQLRKIVCDNAKLPSEWCRDPVNLTADGLMDLLPATFESLKRVRDDLRSEARAPLDKLVWSPPPPESPITVALYAPPGSGKSHIFNAICGQDVSPSGAAMHAITRFPVRASHDASLPHGRLDVCIVSKRNQPLTNEGHFSTVLDALAHIKRREAVLNETTVLCLDVRLASPCLAELGVVLVDLPGYPDLLNADFMRSVLQPFMCGVQRVDVLAAVGGRVLPDFRVLHELGFFDAQRAEDLPLLLRVYNRTDGKLWETPLHFGDNVTLGDMSEKQLEETIDILRLETIQGLLYHAGRNIDFVAPCNFVELVGRRLDVVPFFTEDDVRTPHNTTFKLLRAVLQHVRRFHAVNTAVATLAAWYASVHTAKHAANTGLWKATKDVAKLVDKVEVGALPHFEVEAALRGACDNVDVQDLLEWALSDQTNPELGLSCYVAALDAAVTQALLNYDDQLCGTVAQVVFQWERLLHESSLPDDVKGLLLEDAQARATDLLARSGDCAPCPSFQFKVCLLAETRQQARVRQAHEAMDSNIVAVLTDWPSLMTDITSAARSIFQRWSDYSVHGPLCNYIKAGRMKPPKELPEALKKAKSDQKMLIKVESALEKLVLTFAPLTHASKTTDMSTPITAAAPLPLVRRVAAPSNDKVLKRPPCQPDEVVYELKETARLATQDVRVLTDITIGPANELSYTAVSDATTKLLQDLSRALPDAGAADAPAPSPVEQQSDYLHPLFVLSKLRGVSSKGKKNSAGVEIVPPSFYLEHLRRDGLHHYVLAVVDADEVSVYLDKFVGDQQQLLLVTIASQPGVPINVGRKRQVIKLLAERVLELTCYWVLDDDLKDLYEVDVNGLPRPCTMARALYFAQVVLARELLGDDGASDVDAFKELLVEVAGSLPKDVMSILFSADNQRTLAKYWQTRGLDQHLIDGGLADKLTALRARRQQRVAQVALSNMSGKPAPAVKKLLLNASASHINRRQLYQCVLFHSPATRNVEYMQPEAFFQRLTPREEEDWRALCARTAGNNAEKTSLANVGFKHEDWLLASELLPQQQRAGYLLFRFGFRTRNVPSVVNQRALAVQVDTAVSSNTD